MKWARQIHQQTKTKSVDVNTDNIGLKIDL